MTELRKAQLVMQDILDYVTEFCDKNEITYWLDSGTLLGAVRHKGFIPWDDDIDICMLRDDYNKFLELFKKNLDKRYRVLNDTEDSDYTHPFTKVLSTLHFCGSSEIKNNGIWIDIFPMDYYNKEFYEELSEFGSLRGKRIKNKRKLKEKVNIFVKIKLLLEQRIIKIKRDKLKRKLLKAQNLGKKEILKYPLSIVIAPENIEYIDVFPIKKVIFEGKKYSSPFNFDIYLKKLYGDYMQLPKKENRVPHFNGKYNFDAKDLERILNK